MAGFIFLSAISPLSACGRVSLEDQAAGHARQVLLSADTHVGSSTLARLATLALLLSTSRQKALMATSASM